MVDLPKHSVTMEVVYEGELHCTATHTPSGTTLSTDAPKDNNGKGETFSPTDLVATALGSCILTTMGISARHMNVELKGAKVTVKKEMAVTPIRRIGRIETIVTMPSGVPAEHREKLERVAHTCPVHKSLHPDVDTPITFVWN